MEGGCERNSVRFVQSAGRQLGISSVVRNLSAALPAQRTQRSPSQLPTSNSSDPVSEIPLSGLRNLSGFPLIATSRQV